MMLWNKDYVWLNGITISTSPIFLDIGAKWGNVSNMLLDEFGGRALAFEPSIAGDKIVPREGLEVSRKAIWVNNNGVEFYDCGSQPSSSSVFKRTPRRGTAIEKLVESITLKDVLQDIDCIDFMSMNIEGAEWPLLESQETIEGLKKVKQMNIQFHTEFSLDKTYMQVMDSLSKALDLDYEVIRRHKRRPIIYVVKRN